MGKEAYEILGVDPQLSGEGSKDLEIRGKFYDKLKGLFREVNSILDGRVSTNSERLSDSEKLREIETKIQEMFKALLAYGNVRAQHEREENEAGSLPTVHEQMKNMQERSNKSVRLSVRGREGTQTLSNAYQILYLPEDPNALSDDKVAQKALGLVRMGVTKKPPYTMDEIAAMLISLQGKMWAYSKLCTAKNRRNYQEQLSCERILQESKEYDSAIATIRREAARKSIRVQIHQTEEGETFSVVEIGRLINKGIIMDEGSTNHYALERVFNGERSQLVFFGRINMKRLREDPKYAEFWRETLLSETTIPCARKYMGGYVGEAKSTIKEVDGEQQELFTLERRREEVAICRRFQVQKRQERQAGNSGHIYGGQPGGGETR